MTRGCLTLVVVANFAGHAVMAEPTWDYGAYLAGECTGCHQIDGSDDGIPSIAGLPVEVFGNALRAYRAAERDHPAMQVIAARLSDEDIASLALYFKDPE